jgi:hypothetical protein
LEIWIISNFEQFSIFWTNFYFLTISEF